VSFWTCDMPISFFKGYIKKNGQQEVRLKQIARHYLSTGFLLDVLLLSIEWLNFLMWALDSRKAFQQFAKSLRMLRYLRSLRAGKLSILSRRLMASCRAAETVAMVRVLLQVCAMLLMCHIVACSWYFLGSLSDDEDRWPVEYKATREERSAEFIYMLCLQWVLSQLGFGCTYVNPDNSTESTFAVVVAMICMIAMTLWLADIVTTLMWIHERKREVNCQEHIMNDYLRQKEVSFELQDRLWRVLKKKMQVQDQFVEEESVALIRNLPAMLDLELRAEVFVRVLTRHPFFGTYGVSGADPRAMLNLIRRHATRSELLDDKQELFAEREYAEKMHFVVHGCMLYCFKYQRMEIKQHQWLGEPGLWLMWEHAGYALAVTPCSVVQVECALFREIVRVDLPEARKYAKAFCLYAQLRKHHMNDVLPDVLTAGIMAQEAFTPPQAFELAKCQPVMNKYQDEWHPQDASAWQDLWSSPWAPSHLASSSALILSMTTEMKRDAILLYQTMFAQNIHDKPLLEWSSGIEQRLFDNRLFFLKRLMICLAMCQVCFTDKENSSELEVWPYPLASLLCHGGRLLVRLHGVQPHEFVNFLLLGDADCWNWERQGIPSPLYSRIAGSHGVKLDQFSQLVETKLKGTNALSLSGHHVGMDLPVGGLGNPTPKPEAVGGLGNPSPKSEADNMKVGPAGVPFKRDGKKCIPVGAIQHGHLYVRLDDFGSRPLRRLSLNNTRYHDKDPQATQTADFLSTLSSQTGFDHGESWDKLNTRVDTLEKLEQLLVEGSCEALATDQDRLGLLFKYAVEESELTIERNSRGELRCRGAVVFLTIEAEGEGSHLVLVYAGAQAAGESSDGKCDRQGQIKQDDVPSVLADARDIAFLCKRHGLWLPGLMQYTQDSFHLSDEAAKTLFQSLAEEAYLARIGPLPSICHHHKLACGESISLTYDALYLKATISAKDNSFSNVLFGTRGGKVSSKEKLFVHGSTCASHVSKRCVTRQWTWMRRQDAQKLGVHVLQPSSNAVPLRLLCEDNHVASLLIGIEASAPRKENFFGKKHTAAAKSNEYSAFGRRKWRDFRNGGLKVPTDRGGVQALLNRRTFEDFVKRCKELELCVPSSPGSLVDGNSHRERQFFQRLLQSCASETTDILEALGAKPLNRTTSLV